jgi:cell division septum initiation protein DivIVA
MGIPERDALRAEVASMNNELPALRREKAGLEASVVPLRVEVAALISQQDQVTRLQSEIATLSGQRDSLNVETVQLRQMLDQMPDLKAEFENLSSEIVETRDIAMLQEVGVYQYRHPLDDAVAYKGRLSALQDQIKTAVKSGHAVVGATNWTVNGSERDGTRMVKQFSKLMLRAYNNEADNAVRAMKPYALDSSIARLAKAKDTITKLGKTMNITVTEKYHHLRVTELEYTADFLAKLADEKERDREERARLRDEATAQREMEHEKDRLRKEKAHYEEAIAQLRAQGDHDKADEAQAHVGTLDEAIAGVEYRQANIRTGNVYVISNMGAFGPEIVKIGMTRRQDPLERVRELGDASVPFHYDVHAMVFSEDAVGLETFLHHELADCRVNLVNMRREFFRCHPSRVREILLARDASIVKWVEEPVAAEWRQSETTRRQTQAVTSPAM